MVYIIEEWNSCDCEYAVFESLEDAANAVRAYYRSHFLSYYEGWTGSVEALIGAIEEDMNNLDCQFPFIEDEMYIKEAHFYAKGENGKEEENSL